MESEEQLLPSFNSFPKQQQLSDVGHLCGMGTGMSQGQVAQGRGGSIWSYGQAKAGQHHENSNPKDSAMLSDHSMDN